MSPHSHSGEPGVVVLCGSDGIERIYVFHASDPLCGVVSVFGHTAHDVLDLVIATEFGTTDDAFRRGLAELAKRYGVTSECEVSSSLAFPNWKYTDQPDNVEEPDDPEPVEKVQKLIKTAVRELNKNFAFTVEGGKAIILRKRVIKERLDIERIQPADFVKMYANQKFYFYQGGRLRSMSLGKLWLEHKDRRQYLGGVVFDPSNQTDPTILNLWTGFGVKPAIGSWAKMQDHTLNVICGGNEEHFEYILNWCARMMQYPARQGEVAVVLRSGEGTGKGIFARALIQLLGRHGRHVAQARHVVGHFNQHLKDTVFLFCDEAFQVNDKQQVGALKVLVTEPTLTIEAKFQNAVQEPNFIHLMMASNEDWVVPAGLESRRFFVLEVLGTKVCDRAYFQAIADEMGNGGYEAMLYDLLERDISGFSVTTIPKTAALAEQKKLSFKTEVRWWQDVLMRGYVFRSKLGLEEKFSLWFEKPTVELLFASYRDFVRESHERFPLSREMFGRFLASLGGTKCRPTKGYCGEHLDPMTRMATPVEADNRPNAYHFGILSDARRGFETYVGFTIDWPEE